jgi:hypothetical protein
LIGKEGFANDDLVLANFSLLRIVNGDLENLAKLDTLKLPYRADVRHLSCLPPTVLSGIVKDAGKDTIFNNSVYFHPNFRADGWEQLMYWHRKIRQSHPGVLPLPAQPKFWQHGIRGSAISLWPPQFFDTWISSISQGIPLTWDSAEPTAEPTAGPSNPNPTISLHSPASSLSTLSPSPPPSPPPPPPPSPSPPPPSPPSLPFHQSSSSLPSLQIKKELLEGDALLLSNSQEQLNNFGAQLNVDGFELTGFGQAQGSGQLLVTPPGSPASRPGEDRQMNVDDDDALWDQVGPMQIDDTI